MKLHVPTLVIEVLQNTYRVYFDTTLTANERHTEIPKAFGISRAFSGESALSFLRNYGDRYNITIGSDRSVVSAEYDEDRDNEDEILFHTQNEDEMKLIRDAVEGLDDFGFKCSTMP